MSQFLLDKAAAVDQCFQMASRRRTWPGSCNENRKCMLIIYDKFSSNQLLLVRFWERWGKKFLCPWSSRNSNCKWFGLKRLRLIFAVQLRCKPAIFNFVYETISHRKCLKLLFPAWPHLFHSSRSLISY